MKIVILQGSPNRRGSTYLLADAFRQGAESAGHTVEIVDVAHANIRPCTGCIACGYEGACSKRDDMDGLRAKFLGAEMLVFATPLYYFGMSAQLKTVIDRFCAFNASLTRRRVKCALLAVAWNGGEDTFDALEVHYRALVRYLSMRDMGMVLGGGCGTPAMTRSSRCLR